MITTAKTLRGMFTVLCFFLSMLVYKVLVHGRREAFLFMPLIGVWLVLILVVYWFSKKERHTRA